MARLQGGDFYAVDDKGRVVIPMRFRSQLGEPFVITRGLHRCLFLFTMEEWNALTDKLTEGPLFDLERMKLQRFFFEQAQEVTPDTQGRIAIPQELREWAGITPNSEVRIIGCTRRVEVWSRERYRQVYGEFTNDEEMSQLAVKMGL